MNGLIGKNVQISFSKIIHESISNTIYDLISSDDVKIIKNLEFNGLNITNPYKQEVIKYVDVLDEEAKIIGSVNTVIKRDDLLYGYNTDYYGFIKTLEKFNISLENKKVLILGNGATSKMAQLACLKSKAKQVSFLVRTKRNHDEYGALEVHKVLDSEIIINTTPIGNINNDLIPFDLDLEKFKCLEAVIDLNYNPLRSKILLEAKKYHKNAVNGLYMLVAQALKANYLLTNNSDILKETDSIYDKIHAKIINIALIGMPGSGKTTIAQNLSKILSKNLIDTDLEFEKEYNTSTASYLQSNPEESFREKEKQIVKKVGLLNNTVIATGGGVILNEENILNLRKNSIIIFINRDLELLKKENYSNRPLIKNINDLEQTYKARIDKYIAASSITINNNGQVINCVNEIKVKLNEIFNNQWS